MITIAAGAVVVVYTHARTDRKDVTLYLNNVPAFVRDDSTV